MEQKISKKDFEKLRRQSLNYSIKDGAAYSVMDSAGNGYISPFAIALGASNSFIGLLASLPGLISSLFQLKSPKLMERYSRKSIVTTFALFQAFMWLPILIVSLFNLKLKYSLFLLLFLYIILVSFNSAIAPAWSSWMKDLVPKKESGKFFGRRSTIVGSVGLIALLFVGFVLDEFKQSNKLFLGFAFIFSIAFFARVASRHFLLKKYEPKLKLSKKYYFGFFNFLQNMCYNNFGRFALFVALFQFAVNVASPFFTVYTLRQLKFTYTMFTFIVTAQTLATLITLPLWGRFSDKYGNIRSIKISSLLIPLIPLLWLFSDNFYYLMAVQIFSGFVWAGFNLSTFNFVYDAVTRERMGLCVAYSGVLTTVGVFLGASLGGFLSTNIITDKSAFFILLAVSGLLRFLVPLIMLPQIKEVRKVKRIRIGETILTQIYNTMKFLRITP